MGESERRTQPRFPDTTRVQLNHVATDRDIPARCRDMSRSGMYLHVPANAPVQAGQTVRLTLGSVACEPLCDLSERQLAATIARVDREALVSEGMVGIGVHFNDT